MLYPASSQTSPVNPTTRVLTSIELAAVRLKTIQTSEPFRKYLYDELNVECGRFFHDGTQDKSLIEELADETLGMAESNWDNSRGQNFFLSYDECLIFRRVFPKVLEAVCRLLTQDDTVRVEAMNEFFVEKNENKVVLTHVRQGHLMDLLVEQFVQEYEQRAIKRAAW